MSLIEATKLPASSSRGRPLHGQSGAPAGLAEDLQVLQNAGARTRYRRGETIFNEGDSAEFAYSVVCGAVRLCKHMADGRRQIAQFLLPGDFFSFVEMAEHSFTAEAVDDVVLACYPVRQIERLSNERPALRHFFGSLLAQRIKDVQNHLVMLGRQSAKEKIASFLVMLLERRRENHDSRLEVPMGRQDIADFLGLTIETVCRVLSVLKRERIIGIPALNELLIRDEDALCALAEGGE